MSEQPQGDAADLPAYTEQERRRLIEQATIFRRFTEQFLIEAGIGRGMRVLDVGCGVGDVTLLMAELVGPDGVVVGVDRDARALQLARERAAGHGQVTFAEGDLRELAVDEPFDAAIGRLVLLYLGDPVTAIRRVAGSVRPGGVVGFQDLDFSMLPPACWPPAPLFERCIRWLGEVQRRAGMEMQMGLKYRWAFMEAGLPAPELRMDVALGGGPDFAGYQYIASTVRSALPLMERMGVATAVEVDVDTLADRLRVEAEAGHGTITLPPLAGAWARTLVE
jgi:SAM-dependent methyltransferase